MSKDKTPWIGDIWLDKEGRKMFLYQVTDKYLHFLRMKYNYPEELNRCVMVTFVRDSFLRSWGFTYLGKSKVNIQQLFEVQE